MKKSTASINPVKMDRESKKSDASTKREPKPYFDYRDFLRDNADFDQEDGALAATPPNVPTGLREKEATQKLFHEFGVGQCGDRDHGPKLIVPVAKLDNCTRYRPSTSKADGSPLQLQLRMITQWPSQKEDGLPLFQLANLSQTYEEMEKEMLTTYASFTGDHMIGLEQVHKGFYGILEMYDEEETMLLKRVRVVEDPMKFPDGTPLAVPVELIDDHFMTTVCPQDNIFYLDKYFATLPPRVTAIQMEGMSHYRNNEFFRRFVRRTSDEFLFEGDLQAEVQPSQKVVVWSEQFPREKFPYGINGFITRSIIDMTREAVLKLPSIGDSKQGVFVVHVDYEGYIWVQFQNDISAHFLEICNSIPHERLLEMRGAVTLAEVDQSNDIYFAPHAMSGGTFYRAVIDHSKERTDEIVPVKFIDYGDTDYVAVKELVRVGEVHYLLPHFPPICVHLHLQNIWGLKARAYLDLLYYEFNCGRERIYTLHVIKGATGEEPAEVILFPTVNHWNDACLNYQLVEADLAGEIDPFYEYDRRTEIHWPLVRRPTAKLKLYLGLGHGRRLAVGDQLQASISYDGSMRAYMFLTPSHRIPKREALDDQLKKSYEEQPRIQTSSIFSGAGVICRSAFLKLHCRAILIKAETVTVPLEGIGEAAMIKRWRVYLLDYGVLEHVPVTDMRVLRPAHVDLPALGVRIKNRKLRTKAAVQGWWLEVVGRLDMDALAKIITISSDQCGEIAEVDFPDLEIPGEGSKDKEDKSNTPASTSSTEIGGNQQEIFSQEKISKENPSEAQLQLKVTPDDKKSELKMEDKPSETIVPKQETSKAAIFVPDQSLSGSNSEDGHMDITFSADAD